MSSSPFHQLTQVENCGVTSDWLSRELSRAQSCLDQVNTALTTQQRRRSVQDDGHDDDHPHDSCHHHDRHFHDASSPKDNLCKLQLLSNRIDCLSIAARYLDAIQMISSSSSSDSNASSKDHHLYSMQQLITLESQLGTIVQSFSEEYTAGFSSREFQQIYNEIRNRHDKVQRHIRARAVLTLRKTFQDVAFPSSHGLQCILSEVNSHDFESYKSDLHTSMWTLQKMDVELLARELARPLIQRVQHHFLKSDTIPKDKILKIPHLLFAYLKQVLPYVVPIVEEVQCELYFYNCVNGLIQHVMFQRGFFEKLGGANVMAMTNLVQDILKYDDYILSNYVRRREGWVNMPTLLDKLVCANRKLLDGWIHVERTHAISALDHSGKDHHGCDAIVSTAEVFHSLIHSHCRKISFLRQTQKCRIRYFQQVLLSSCMHYLNILHRRANGLKSAMDKSTIYDLSVNSAEWIMLIQCTEQAAQTLVLQQQETEENDQDGTGRKSHLPQQLRSLSESFEKFSVAMVEECSQRLVDLLMERTTFSSFLMTAGHLLSHGHSGGIPSDRMEDVCMVLSVWSDDASDSSERKSIKDRILGKACGFVEQQLLEIVFDESLYMIADGCKVFSEVVSGVLRELNGRRHQCGRLGDVCKFMPQVEKFREPLYILLGKEGDEKLDFLELEGDGTLYSEIEHMLQVKGFSYINVEDAISLVNRIRK